MKSSGMPSNNVEPESKEAALQKKHASVMADTKDLLASITGSSYSHFEKQSMLLMIDHEVKLASMKLAHDAIPHF